MNDPKPKAPNSSVPLARVWFDEREAEAAASVVRSGWLISGPKVEAFEQAFAARVGAKHAVAVSSGSTALLVAMGALGIGPGDEVIAPDMTFVVTASAALFLGATPRFCDIERRTYGMEPRALERAITPRTKLIVPVHYAGQSCELGPLVELARARGVPVLEDAAESHLATWAGRCTGTLGRAGIFSFTPTKPMSTGEGGMIVTDDAELAARCRRFRNFGDHGKFDWRELGFNFRMAEVMGAIGLQQLDKLEAAVAKRREVAARYRSLLRDCELLQLPHERSAADHVYQLFTVLLDVERLSVSRDRIVDLFGEAGIATRAYYPPLHRAGVFAAHGPFDDALFPNTLWFSARCVSLPIYPGLGAAEQERVASVLRSLLERHRR
jgi:perosamine synthetase